MAQSELSSDARKAVRISFEFFPPKSPDMEGQLWQTVEELSLWQPDFVSVTYGAGGTTREPTLAVVRRMIAETPMPTAAHLTCVGATRDEVLQVVDEFCAAGVRHFVALRGDSPNGVGSKYVPHPGGFASSYDLVAALRARKDVEVSVSAYPERHPESADDGIDIDMLKRKVDAGATRALTQFFFDNDIFERYLEKVRAAGITIPIIPGIMPIQNLTQLKRFASMCGASIPVKLDERFAGLDDQPQARADMAADIAAEQIADLVARGINDFHLYTMNRSALTNATLKKLGLRPKAGSLSGAAA
ncbi:methylenetetrahydrofolate reductase [NAD(P)H] [Peteryoungia desertarenae]|uniref:Methylenetetrahydrofolate reductase n=1 Tax=Peteryoungia desertarenae TaxID=1813451 RepID=A0ABX6QQT9_9HYPH|nr:methylenetetrahydrofolate reductase [NAD(P)H] [Peteryoungia desertarenae]QLF70869.1 methylenetetrahydrofolate reductase [NAD(P)H] [Peteryoungia desertarenae]